MLPDLSNNCRPRSQRLSIPMRTCAERSVPPTSPYAGLPSSLELLDEIAQKLKMQKEASGRQFSCRLACSLMCQLALPNLAALVLGQHHRAVFRKPECFDELA